MPTNKTCTTTFLYTGILESLEAASAMVIPSLRADMALVLVFCLSISFLALVEVEASSLTRRFPRKKMKLKPTSILVKVIEKYKSKHPLLSTEHEEKPVAPMREDTDTTATVEGNKAPAENSQEAAPAPDSIDNAPVPKMKGPLPGIYTNKPVLRGQFHKWGAILYPPLLGLPLCLKASKGSDSSLLVATLLFGLGIEVIFAVSATLHTFRWQTEWAHQIARKLDFTAIFFGIACCYSSLGRLLMGDHPWWFNIERLVWTCACLGTLMKWRIPDAPHVANAAIFLVQGWATLPAVPTLLQTASLTVAGGLAAGGIVVTLGTICYGLQWPRNKENKAQHEIIFGPHEMFHVGSLLMVSAFWFSMWTRVSETLAATGAAV